MKNIRKKLLLVGIISIFIMTSFVVYIKKENSKATFQEVPIEEETEEYEPEKFEDKIKEIQSEAVQIESLKTDKDKFEDVDITNEDVGVPVLCYHSIGDDESGKDPLVISVQRFRAHMKGLKDNGYTSLTMKELDDYLENNKPIPVKSIIITFDDGYKDNYTNAFPVLKEFNMKATMFVVPSLLDGETSMTSEQVKEMSDYGIDIESHTYSHNRLNEMSYSEQLKEFSESKAGIEALTGKSVVSAAYPEGKYNENTKKAIKDSGYKMGFTTEHGYADREDDYAALNRICIDYTFNWNNVYYIINNINK